MKKNENVVPHLSALIESSLDAIFSKDLDGYILSWNKGAELMYGYSAGEIIGRHISTLVPQELMEELSSIMSKIKNDESISNLETIRLKKNKEKINVSLNISPIRNAKGKIIAASTIDHNITQQKQAEEALKISQQQYKNIFEFSPIGIYTSNYKGQILSANLAFAKILGCNSIEEVLKLNLAEDIYFDKKERSKLIAQYENTNSAANIGVKWKKRTGKPLWVELSVHMVKDFSGRTLYFEGFVRDITNRKLGEEQIFVLSRAVHQSPVSIIILDLKGNIEYVNSKFAQVKGCSLEEIKKTKPNLLLTPLLSSQEKKVIWNTITSNSEWRGEFQHKGKDNEIIWESASVSPVINEKGKNTYYIAIFQDITKRKLQEEQLIIAKEKAEKSDKLKTEFLAQMSHEIRTPLNNILTYTSILKEEFEDKLPEGIESAFDVIDNSSQRLIRTIELILNLSRVQTGNFETKFEVFDLHKDLLEDLTLEFFSRAKMKNLSFVYENNSTNTLTYADKYSLGQVFINLFDNAIKYTEKGGIQIILNELNNKISVSISDTGIGISPQYLPNIFNPFSQEKFDQDKIFEGTGLGLALVKKYVEINKAEIKVVSEKWKGSTFTVILSTGKNNSVY